jgi:hypothetical protein
MDDSNVFAKIVVIGLVAALASITSCTAYVSHDDNMAMDSMVENGAHPIDARCAVKSDTESRICLVRITAK